MAHQLEEPAALRAALDAVIAGTATSQKVVQWTEQLRSFFADVDEHRTPEGFRDPAFLERLWDANPVSAVGNGTVKVGSALQDPAFLDWFSSLSTIQVPEDSTQAEVHLTALYDDLMSRLQALCKRTPRLKANRVLCALFPNHFTTVADEGTLLYIHRAMGGSAKDHPVHAHLSIRRQIDAALGPAASTDPLDEVRRACLPWLLYERLAGDKADASTVPTEAETKRLVPQPATLRRKGLTAMKGGFQTLLGLLPPLDEGMNREEFVAHIQQVNPDLVAASYGAFINVVHREFDLCTRQGDTYRLSPRGLNLLKSQDPNEFADHLLTKILGVDHVVHALADKPVLRPDLLALLQKVNPGWTSTFAPGALLTWLTSLGVMTVDDSRICRLTELGQRWRDLVTWEPEFLAAPPKTVEDFKADKQVEVTQLPAWPKLSTDLKTLAGDRLRFDENLVRQLHAGLWFHPVRHFAVLTGLSGSGKTQLALQYARALCGADAVQEGRVKVIAVQPGWFDPSPLLGSDSPLQQNFYRRAPFLDLLLSAEDNPSQPYVAILDEMNLSHPEQYLAPILSAMETRGIIELHSMSADSTQVPQQVVYPANLALVGTVNMDETTHGLSDKVLDRAFTLEFWNIKVADYPRWSTTGLSASLRDKAQAVLQGFSDVLAPLRLHFGWRTIDDVVGYLAFAVQAGTPEGQALDDALYAKVLPKLRGEGLQRFESALAASRKLAQEHSLTRCHDKLASMQADLAETGATRFWR